MRKLLESISALMETSRGLSHVTLFRSFRQKGLKGKDRVGGEEEKQPD